MSHRNTGALQHFVVWSNQIVFYLMRSNKRALPMFLQQTAIWRTGFSTTSLCWIGRRLPHMHIIRLSIYFTTLYYAPWFWWMKIKMKFFDQPSPLIWYQSFFITKDDYIFFKKSVFIIFTIFKGCELCIIQYRCLDHIILLCGLKVGVDDDYYFYMVFWDYIRLLFKLLFVCYWYETKLLNNRDAAS